MTTTPADLQTTVRARYGDVARRVRNDEASPGCGGGSSGCCGTAAPEFDAITADLYQLTDTEDLPAKAVLASLGCGNPTALAELRPGETVLDLGSGGGIDVLLSAKRVGPTGTAYGLDMTEEMLALAEENRRKANATNVSFLKGEIEHIPLPDASVDVIISNCVINLAVDKAQVLREAYRVLKPGGRFAVSDIVVQGELPAHVRQDPELWVACVAGALEENEYLRLLGEAGFEDAGIEVTRIITQGEDRVVSAYVRARKTARVMSIQVP